MSTLTSIWFWGGVTALTALMVVLRLWRRDLLVVPYFQLFVAWRYLMSRPHRVSRLAIGLFIGGLVVGVGCVVAVKLLFPPPNPRSLIPAEVSPWAVYLGYVSIGAFAIAHLAWFFGGLRFIFTFFTTVPIGGVWIGSAALVCVLSVMNGFEADLRVKILGSNAHIQVTRTDGPFVDWEAVKGRIDGVPGVVASMPFATTEAVIAANSSYATVIVKGIDPDTLGKVTRLGRDVDDPAALRRMWPLVEDELPTDVSPPTAPSTAGGAVVDPAPDDMPGGAAPLDFSTPAAAGTDAGVAGGGDEAGEGAAAGAEEGEVGAAAEPGAEPGAADKPAPAVAVLDPVPDDFEAPALPPEDLSHEAPDAGAGRARVIAIGPDGVATDRGFGDEMTMSKRTASLPGILVGRELVKQIHLYAGQEVRVVSPLSDPANPDATGTPIPYNRDYRVAGIFFTGMYEYDLKFVYVPLDSLQDFLDLGDTVDGIEVRITDPEATTGVAAQIGAALGSGYVVKDWKELNRNLFSALKLEKIAMFLVLAIIILVASFSIVGNLIMVVVEKSKEIALLKTLGASDHGVTLLFVIQGLLIGVVGTTLGVVFGLVACWAAKTYGLPLNPDVYYIDRLPIHVDPLAVVAVQAAGILISVGATVYPALVAARLRPAVGLRHD